MSKTNLSLLATAFIILSLNACTKEDTETAKTNATTSTGGGATAAFACKIDGTDFTADSSRVNFYSGGFSIMAFKSGTTAFEINLNNPAVGTHPLTGGAESATYITGQTFYTSQTGTVTISAIDSATTTASGTFNFVGLNPADSTTKTFSAGTFSVK